MENETKEQKYKVIIKPSIARQLLKLGNHIVDIKPNKDNPLIATVFVFEFNDKFKEDLKYLKKIK